MNRPANPPDDPATRADADFPPTATAGLDSMMAGLAAQPPSQVAASEQAAADARALLASSDLHRLILNSASDGMLILSRDGRVQQVNESACVLLELRSPEQLRQVNWLSLWDTPERGSARDAVLRARAGEVVRFSAFSYTTRRTPKWWDVVASPIRAADGGIKGVLVAQRDITQLHLREQQVRELNAQLEQRVEARTQDLIRSNYQLHNALTQVNDLYEYAPCGYLTMDFNGRIDSANQTTLRWLKLRREEVIAKLLLRDLLRDADLERFDQMHSWVRAGRNADEQEYDLRRSDGSWFTALLTFKPVLDFEGRFVNTRMAMVDINARREAEEAIRRMNEDLERANGDLAQANQELESFSYTVSHDLRSPLRHIKHYIELGREAADLGNTQDFVTSLDQMAHSIDNMGRLIDGLLDLARLGRTSLNEMPFGMGELIAEAMRPVVNEAQNETPPRVIEWDVAQDFPELPCDPVLLRQVWGNLMGNAVKYSRGREVTRIAIGWRPEGQDRLAFWISDNGVGFDARQADKLFGMFQRLHSPSEFEGTGIGLALTRKIIERHGGSIRAEGAVGQGCTITFTLPRQGLA